MTNFRNDKMGFKLSEIGGRIILIFEKWGFICSFPSFWLVRFCCSFVIQINLNQKAPIQNNGYVIRQSREKEDKKNKSHLLWSLRTFNGPHTFPPQLSFHVSTFFYRLENVKFPLLLLLHFNFKSSWSSFEERGIGNKMELSPKHLSFYYYSW